MAHITKVLDVQHAFEKDLKGGTGYEGECRRVTAYHVQVLMRSLQMLCAVTTKTSRYGTMSGRTVRADDPNDENGWRERVLGRLRLLCGAPEYPPLMHGDFFVLRSGLILSRTRRTDEHLGSKSSMLSKSFAVVEILLHDSSHVQPLPSQLREST